MKKFAIAIATATLSLLPLMANASGGGHNEYIVDAPINPKDKVSLQNGAQLFVNNCMGCHGLKYMRYERMSEDLGIPVELTQQYLNFTTDKPGDTMGNAMLEEESKVWFGVAPPDLSLEARLRSSDWLYSYLINFYEDASRPYGYNNHVFPSVGMPHVMADMEEELDKEEFEKNMADLTNFLAYVAEPVRLERERLGVYVLLFLFILFWPAYFMKKEFWKDIH
ncbi:MAG: cytochrome c1 [Gammaproteobacteria bacterium]|jgi:ubiquinol-cytochrome c reductase cytochrome c1 subunit|nr:cytochrome c1 [Gammaproteobacteria bacterium]MBQ0775331.1 cytochrome c1 [Gammaproteobacteria bacterium]|tara:strand:- start:101760 stop:102428 length:669 start_codon:yes stop_codon:yes gene_type:complete